MNWKVIHMHVLSHSIVLSIVALSTCVSSTLLLGGEKEPESKALAHCPVSGEPISIDSRVSTDDGPVYFCCDDCIKKFEAEPARYAEKVAKQREELAKREKIQVTCPVSGEPVDTEVSTKHDDTTVYFCCNMCKRKYERAPGEYAEALANSYTYQTVCPVMGGKIDPTAFTKLPTGQTVYYCCQMCDKQLLSDGAKYHDKLVAQGVIIDWEKLKKLNDSSSESKE